MPLSIENIIQVNTGSFNSTGGNATLPNPVTSGSTVVIVAACPSIAADSNVMVTANDAAFEAIAGCMVVTVLAAMPTIFAKRNVTDGSTSWGLTPKKGGVASSRQVTWLAAEVTGVGLDPLGTGNLSWFSSKDSAGDPHNDTLALSSFSTFLSGVTTPSSCYDTLGLAVFAAKGADATVPVWSAYTDGWLELGQVGRTDAGVGFGMAVAYKPSMVLGARQTVASLSPASAPTADAVSLYADGAQHARIIQMMSGAEFGSMTGAATMTGVNKIFDTFTANVTCVTNIKRTGNYGFKFASTAAPANGTWSAKLFDMTSRAFPWRLNVYFETALPGVDVELASFEVGSKTGTLTYRTASQKLEVKIGTGTAVLSDAVVVANQWIGIDGRYDSRGIANAQHICDWQVDYNANLADTTGPVVQTQAVGAGTSAGTFTLFRMGWTQSITATVYMDDLAVSRSWGSYPLGDLRLHPLKVDAAGTPTVNGDASLFKTFTSNGGTLTTWAAAATRTNLAEVPPTIGSTSSGLTQVTVGASGGILDWVNIPIETYDAAANAEAIRAVGHYAAGWAASTTAAGAAMSVYDGRSGSEIATGWAAADCGWDSTTQIWAHWMHHSGMDPAQFYPILQSHLDAMEYHFGQSTDATPDIGIHCILSEVATQPAVVYQTVAIEDNAFQLYVRQDPVTSAVVSYLVVTPPGTRGTYLNYSLAGVDQTPIYVNPNTVYEFPVGAADADTVTGVGLNPDPTPET